MRQPIQSIGILMIWTAMVYVVAIIVSMEINPLEWPTSLKAISSVVSTLGGIYIGILLNRYEKYYLNKIRQQYS